MKRAEPGVGQEAGEGLLAIFGRVEGSYWALWAGWATRLVDFQEFCRADTERRVAAYPSQPTAVSMAKTAHCWRLARQKWVRGVARVAGS